MYFKNLQIYRILPDWRITADDLEQQLARRPFTPPGAQDFESRGWVSPADDGALVRTVGDKPTRLALTFDDRASFVLTQRLELKRVEYLDVVRESITDDDREDAQALFDAEFALMTGELLRLLDATVAALGGELAREPGLVDQAKEAA